MTFYDHNMNPGPAEECISRVPDKGIFGNSALANACKQTTLEQCRDRAMDNMNTINAINSRITALLNRLRGNGSMHGGVEDIKGAEPQGMLLVHLEQLEYEARRLGEIEADLSLLESLL